MRHEPDEQSAADERAELQRVREIAAAIGCVVDEDLQLFGRLTTSTIETWRKRGEGPPVCRFGNRYFYPLDGLAEFIKSRVRVPSSPNPKGLL